MHALADAAARAEDEMVAFRHVRVRGGFAGGLEVGGVAGGVEVPGVRVAGGIHVDGPWEGLVAITDRVRGDSGAARAYQTLLTIPAPLGIL